MKQRRKCPLCGGKLIPMSSGKGFRCENNKPRKVGDKWVNGGTCEHKEFSSSGFPARKQIDRPSTWRVIENPTEEQLAIFSQFSQAPQSGGRLRVVNAGPGCAKTSTDAAGAKYLWQRVGDLSGWHAVAFNRHAADDWAASLPLEFANVSTINSCLARAQGYKYQQYQANKLWQVFSGLTDHLPKDQRPRMGIIGSMVERMRDILLFNSDDADAAWWSDACECTIARFPGLARKWANQRDHVLRYLPAVFVRSQADAKKIDIGEQCTRPTTDAIARTGWTMPLSLAATKYATAWSDQDVAHIARLVKAVRIEAADGLIIDEAQDLSLAQMVALVARVWRTGELYVVGDDCHGVPDDDDYKAGQGIFGWRGAFPGSMSLLARLWEELTGEAAVNLSLSYTMRCRPAIVRAVTPLNRQLKSIHPEGGEAVQVSEEEAWQEWIDLPEDTRCLWLTRTNAPLAVLFRGTLKARRKVCLRGGKDLERLVGYTLREVAGVPKSDQAEYPIPLEEAIDNLRELIATEYGDKEGGEGEDPNALEPFLLSVMEDVQQDPTLLQEAILPAKATCRNVQRMLAYFSTADAPRILSTVYRAKGDECDLCIVSDTEQFNTPWGGDEVESAACRLVAATRAKHRLLVVGSLLGVQCTQQVDN